MVRAGKSKRNRLYAFLCAGLLCCTAAAAQPAPSVNLPSTGAGTITMQLDARRLQPDTLIPANTSFTGTLTRGHDDDYATVVMKAMPEAFAPQVVLRYVVLDAFSGGLGGSGEYVMAMEPAREGWRLFASASTGWLWRYTESGREQAWEYDRQRLRSDGYRNVRIERCTAQVNKEVGNRIVSLWQDKIRIATSPTYIEGVVFDAPEVYVIAKVGDKMRAARPYKTMNKERVLTFFSVVQAMGDVCEKPNSVTRTALVKALDEASTGSERK